MRGVCLRGTGVRDVAPGTALVAAAVAVVRWRSHVGGYMRDVIMTK